MRLDPFYPVVENADWVVRVVSAGARLVQLRMKDLEPAQRRFQAQRSKAVCEQAGATLVLNDYWELALEEGIGFIHLGQDDLQDADLAAVRRAAMRLGVSTHDGAELDRALATDPDYVALGPIYPTTLKVMPWAPQGLERIGEWKRLVGDRPLVAIGGITLERIGGVLAAGADCVAVVSDVVRAADPEAQVQAWISATRQAA